MGAHLEPAPQHPRGEFAGVVLVTLQLKYFQNYYSTFEVGPNGTIGMTNDDGIVLVRWPDKPGVIGTSIAGTSIYVTMRAQARHCHLSFADRRRGAHFQFRASTGLSLDRIDRRRGR